MEQFQNRKKARVVAFVDLVLTSLSIWVPIILVIAAIRLTVVSNNGKIQEQLLKSDDQSKGISIEKLAAAACLSAAVIWVAFVILTAIVIIQLVAAVKLLNATQIGKNPTEGAKLCRFWRNTTIVFTVLGPLGVILSIRTPTDDFQIWSLIWSWIFIALHILGIYFVQRFMMKLSSMNWTLEFCLVIKVNSVCWNWIGNRVPLNSSTWTKRLHLSFKL